jgi:aldose 1-epimerase
MTRMRSRSVGGSLRSFTLLGALLLGCAGAAQQQPSPAPTAEAAASPPPAPLATQAPAPAAPAKAAAITQAPFGKADGKDVTLYTLKNANGLVMKVTDYGTIITELWVPDRAGKLADIVLGFDNLDGYLKGHPYFGATVGRIGNRIRGAKFKLDGKEYKLNANEKPDHLHGGVKGWDKHVWTAAAGETPNGPAITFTYVSPDGDEGYPGTVTAKTTYTLTNTNELKVEMEATTDKPTILNMVHHSYFNLGGHGSGPITEHELQLFADQYTPGDPVIPTGAVTPVKGTAFDFTAAKPIGKDLLKAGGKPIGYDHNFVVNGAPHALRPVARLKDPKSGRVLTLDADQPGVQFYSGKFLDGTVKGKGATYPQYTGLCLETQKFPNSINVPAWRDEVILRPGTTYKHVMVHKFSAE